MSDEKLETNLSVSNICQRILEIKYINSNIFQDHFSKCCIANDIETAKMLLQNDKIDVNLYDENGDTYLTRAISKGNYEISRLLIKYPKTDINFKNNHNQTPLTIAVSNQSDEIVEVLINDEKFDKEDGLFNYAFSISSGKITEILINSKYLDINDQIYTENNLPFVNLDDSDILKEYNSQKFKETLLVNAANNQREEIVDIIIQHPNFDRKKSKLNKAIFECAKKCNNIDLYKKLIKLIDFDDFNKYKIDGKSFLNYITDFEFVKNSSIDYSSTNSNLMLSEILDTKGLVFNKNDLNTAFYNIFQNNLDESKDCLFDIDSLEILLKYDKEHENFIDVQKFIENNRTYFTSINKNGRKIFRFFVKIGADPNIPDKYGIYPLQYAFFSNFDEEILMLINSNKIDFKVKLIDIIYDKKFGKKKEIISDLYDFILRSKRSNDMLIQNYTTYLHLAAAYRNPKILQTFLEKRMIDLNIEDDLGNTPLIDACILNKKSNVELLFKMDDLDYHHCNKDGKDALHILDPSLKDHDDVKDKNDYLRKLLTYLGK